MYLPESIQKAFKLLNNYEAYLVGGCIRNHLLNIPINDYDMCTSATPQEIIECFKDYKVIPTGIKHGTITVIIDHTHIEITTFRKDEGITDNRHPKKVIFTSILEEDASRRDFTINSLYYHPDKGIIDYFHGITDIHDHIIRSINDPNIRFQEDALRILRALRFSLQLDFKIENNTSIAIHNNKQLLKKLSAERIIDELKKIMSYPKAYEIIISYYDIFVTIIDDLKYLSHDTTNKMLLALTNSHPSFIIRMAIILSPCNNYHQILKRLKLSNEEIRSIETIIRYYNVPLDNKIQIKYLLKQTSDIDNILLCKKAFGMDTSLIQDTYQKIIANKECYQLKDLSISGKDLINLGINNKLYSTILNECLDKVIQDQLSNNKEILLDYIKGKYL